ncbi:MAG: diguanylate cyclase [Cohnella sp.]|nr:diguanylate cyclase [Cohnella sp.]
MQTSPRVQLVTPFLDGSYYGTIFLTLHHEAKRRNINLYVIQSLVDFQNQIDFPHRIGMEETDGWLLMTNPNSPLPMAPELLLAIEASGKPVVTVGYREDAIQAHTVVTDNRRAAREAVNHLIRDHGHRRIAYIGSKEHVDLIERYEGYLEALAENGVPYDPKLVYVMNDALQPGGRSAAAAMLSGGIAFTAVFAATDLSAIGLTEKLQEAGIRLPEDIAVIGFDDHPASVEVIPPLTTVRQSFTDLALISLDRLDRLIRGERLERMAYLPTELVHRASCGCSLPSMELTSGHMNRSLLQSHADVSGVIERHYRLSFTWGSAVREEHFRFEQLLGEYYPWGCLALWEEDDGEHRKLVVRQSYSRNGLPLPAIGETVPVEQFPPSSWVPNPANNEIVHVHAIRDKKRDWGFIVVLRPIDDLVHIHASDLGQNLFAIAQAALEREDLSRQFRRMTEKLEIVSRATNDGIWDWNVAQNRIEWSIRAFDMLGMIGDNISHEPASFLNLVHHEDKERVRQAFEQSLANGQPIKVEFRIQGQNEVWIYAAGDVVCDLEGNVTRMIGSLTNITERKLAEQRITHLAYHDSLTGLANRQLFRDQVQRSIQYSDRNGAKFGLLLLDLDRFKTINDTLGHQAGDELLQGVADILESVVKDAGHRHANSRKRDLAARIGGDEFILLLDDIDGETDLTLAADRIRRRFEEPFHLLGQAVHSSCSIGFAVYPDDGNNLDELTRSADLKMYRLKTDARRSR